MRRTLILVALIAIVAAPALATDSTRWLNVHVEEASEGATVNLHLPVPMVLAVLRGVDVDGFSQGRIDLDLEGTDIDVGAMVAALHDAPDGEFMTATTNDADVNVRKEAGTLFIDVTEHGGDNARVKVRLPAVAMDALSIDGDTLDVAALIESLDELVGQDLIQVEADDAFVRVWVE